MRSCFQSHKTAIGGYDRQQRGHLSSADKSVEAFHKYLNVVNVNENAVSYTGGST